MNTLSLAAYAQSLGYKVLVHAIDGRLDGFSICVGDKTPLWVVDHVDNHDQLMVVLDQSLTHVRQTPKQVKRYINAFHKANTQTV